VELGHRGFLNCRLVPVACFYLTDTTIEAFNSIRLGVAWARLQANGPSVWASDDTIDEKRKA
jgi:hypothetical protein